MEMSACTFMIWVDASKQRHMKLRTNRRAWIMKSFLQMKSATVSLLCVLV
jgi:hypothetical protein